MRVGVGERGGPQEMWRKQVDAEAQGAESPERGARQGTAETESRGGRENRGSETSSPRDKEEAREKKEEGKT